ncbi:MAG: hypothetical protein ACXWV0_02360 [Flavisolibacter sp.]
MKKLVAGIGFLVIYLSAQSQQVSVRDLKSGNHEPDTSFIYTLPFSKGKSYLLIQAYQSKMSHKGEYALDFKMKRGTTVCAARAGIVTALREDSKRVV